MESQKSFANRKTACFPRASVFPGCHRPMRLDVESFFFERQLLHRKMPSSRFDRAREQRILGHVFCHDCPQ